MRSDNTQICGALENCSTKVPMFLPMRYVFSLLRSCQTNRLRRKIRVSPVVLRTKSPNEREWGSRVSCSSSSGMLRWSSRLHLPTKAMVMQPGRVCGSSVLVSRSYTLACLSEPSFTIGINLSDDPEVHTQHKQVGVVISTQEDGESKGALAHRYEDIARCTSLICLLKIYALWCTRVRRQCRP